MTKFSKGDRIKRNDGAVSNVRVEEIIYKSSAAHDMYLLSFQHPVKGWEYRELHVRLIDDNWSLEEKLSDIQVNQIVVEAGSLFGSFKEEPDAVLLLENTWTADKLEVLMALKGTTGWTRKGTSPTITLNTRVKYHTVQYANLLRMIKFLLPGVTISTKV